MQQKIMLHCIVIEGWTNIALRQRRRGGCPGPWPVSRRVDDEDTRRDGNTRSSNPKVPRKVDVLVVETRTATISLRLKRTVDLVEAL